MRHNEYKQEKKEKKRKIKALKKEYKNFKKLQKLKIKELKLELKDLKHKKQEKELTEKQKIKQEKRLNNIKKNQPPRLKVLEEIGNAISHGVGAILAILGLILMINKSTSPIQLVAAIIYCASLFILFAMSSLYHAFKYGLTVKRVFRRFDYSSIYLLIGGTFAPILLVFLHNTLGYVVFAVQWICIIVGITFLGIFGPGRLKWIHFPLYFILGWIGGVCVIPEMLRSNMELFYWILAGGVAYTLGMIPFCLKGKTAHFIWHLIVMVAAMLQFIGIYICLY